MKRILKVIVAWTYLGNVPILADPSIVNALLDER